MNLNAIILAAGKGSRLGNQPKSLIKIKGITLLENLIDNLKKAGITSILIVTGYEANCLETLCHRLNVKTVHNPHYENGNHQESLEIGLRFNKQVSKSDGTIILLADQPLLNSALITKLITYYESLKMSKDVIYPVNNKARGNPTIVSHNFLEIALEETPFDLKKFIKQHSKRVVELSSNEAGYFLDIDTESDIQYLYDNYGIKLELPIK